MESIKDKINNSNEFAVGMLIQLYRFQTQEEQLLNSTNKNNNIGFNAADANFLTKLAKFYLEKGFLTENQLLYAKRLLSKYSRQVENIEIEPLPIRGKKDTLKITNSSKNASLANSNNFIIITFSSPDKEDWIKTKDSIKNIIGSKWVPTKRYWNIPISIDNLIKLKNLGFKFDENLEKFASKIFVKVPTNMTLNIPDFNINLYPFQEDGVKFIECANGVALLADDMGCGKTCQSIAWTALHPEKIPVLIICPASLKINWQREITKAIPTATTHIMQGQSSYIIPKVNYIIINYEILQYHVDSLQQAKPQIMIIDEIHKFKNPNAIRTQTAISIKRNVKHIIGLTGTPVVNKPVDLFYILQIIKPQLFSNFWSFVNTYCAKVKNNGFGFEYIGSKNEDDLHQKLVNTVMIRRTKKEVLKDLPNKIRTVVPIPMKSRKEYEQAWKDFDAFEKIPRNAISRIEQLKQITIRSKMSGIVDWIDNFLENDEKLITFSMHQWTIDFLIEKYPEISVKLDGRDNAETKQKAVDAFQLNPKVRLIHCNVKAGGVGHNLTAASNVAMLELPWTPANCDQAEDRAYRIGQENSVNIWYLPAFDSIEEDIIEIIDYKRKIMEGITDGKETSEISLLSNLMKKLRKRKGI